MASHILMNVVDEQELRVGVIRDGRLEALLHERLGDGQHLGNIYKARVANVEPSLDAAFLDLGSQKNGFIHSDELIASRVIRGDGSGVGRSGKRIEEILRPGDEIIVQVTKEAIKEKGPCMSMYLSVPGRYLVLMNSDQAKGVSKRIEDPDLRRRLKKIIDSNEPPEGMGFIVRTAAADRHEYEIKLDADFLKRLWTEVDGLANRVKAPFCLYQEADVVVRTLRDQAGRDVEAIVIDQEPLFDEARAYAQVFMPELCDRIQLHRDELPLFTYYGLEERIAQLYDRKVELPSGGTIVIEQTEALVSIDVNSSRNRDANDVEQTALMTNLEAVNTIAEQLVLRDLGGLIIIDFIDMENRTNQKLVQLALRRALSADKAKIQVGPMSRFGLVEMTRQRQRPSHKLMASAECPYCVGTGSIKTPETFEIDAMRAIRQALHARSLSRLEVVVPADLAVGVLNNRHKELTELEERMDCRIVFSPDPLMKAREFRLNPTFRKGDRPRQGNKEKAKPVRAALLAPLMAEQAKAAQLARELSQMKPEDLERELNQDPVNAPDKGDEKTEAAREKPVPAVAATAPAAPRAPTLWEEAAVLRDLLFRPFTPQAIAAAPSAGGPALASGPTPATSPTPAARHHHHRDHHPGGRRRRRR
jgi:ribonuclease E